MPTYEYECKCCGFRFEIFQSINAGTESSCPKCAGPARRLLGCGAGIIFKGAGFYATDYRKKPNTNKSNKNLDNQSKSCACDPK